MEGRRNLRSRFEGWLGGLQRVGDLAEVLAECGTKEQRRADDHNGDCCDENCVLEHAGAIGILAKSTLEIDP